MSKFFILTKRNIKEIIREPISLIFCLIFPVFMLILMQLIFSQMDYVPDIFKIENYAVGICVFGYTFTMLSVALLITGDKNTEFVNRLKMSPIKKFTLLSSYLVSMLPIMLLQTILFFVISLIFKLPFSANILLAIIYLLPSALLYLTFGVLIGVIAKNEKQAGPFCSIIISVVNILGGVFMPIDNLGGFTQFLNLLPFSHSIKISSGVFSNNIGCIYPHILWVIGYTLIIWIAILVIEKIKEKHN